jgi:hypothetical protein
MLYEVRGRKRKKVWTRNGNVIRFRYIYPQVTLLLELNFFILSPNWLWFNVLRTWLASWLTNIVLLLWEVNIKLYKTNFTYNFVRM